MWQGEIGESRARGANRPLLRFSGERQSGDTGVLRMEFESAMKRVTELKVERDQAEGRLPKTEIPYDSLSEDALTKRGDCDTPRGSG